MASPNHQQAAAQLSLPSLLETSTADRFGACRLSPAQQAGLEKLGSLWGKILAQLSPIISRNSTALGPLRGTMLRGTFGEEQPFLANWPALAQGAQRLREGKSQDAKEARELLNGLHETALLASLLGSYGTGPFVAHASANIAKAFSGAGELPSFAKRLYQHALPLLAVNAQLRECGIDELSAEALAAGLQKEQARLLEGFAKSRAPLHSKEQVLVEEALSILSADPPLDSALLVATAPSHAPLLAGRLSAALRGAPAGFVQVVGAALGDLRSTVGDTEPKVLVVSALEIPPIQTPVSRVLIYSPLLLNGSRMLCLSRPAMEGLATAFPSASVEVLRTSSASFQVDRALYEQCAPSMRLPSLPGPAAPPPSPSAAGPRAPSPQQHASTTPPAARQRSASIAITLPKTTQGTLFAPAEMAAEPALSLPSAAQGRPFPLIDPATLPKSVEELNARLGITMIKPALIPRADQLEELFRLLELPSMQYLLKAETGFGKTVMASLLMGVRFGNSPLTPQECRRGFRVAYVTPNVNLCAQAKREFLLFLNLEDSEVAILHGKVSPQKRAQIIEDQQLKILVCTPEAFLRTIAAASREAGHDSLAFMVLDEFQTAEGDHPMARLAREARAAGVPIFPQSGTPARNAQDLARKQALVPMRGALVPRTMRPLKTHELLPASLPARVLRLAAELNTFSFIPYVTAREQLKNAEDAIKQATGAAPPTLFPSRIRLTRKPHIESFGPRSSQSFKKLKADSLRLRTQLNALRSALAERGEQLSDTAKQARTDLHLASVNIGRMSSLVSRASLLSYLGSFAFLHNVAATWMAHYLDSPRRRGAFPASRDFFLKPEFRSVFRAVAEGTPYIHLLQSPTTREALQAAFGMDLSAIPDDAAQRRALFLSLALQEMSSRAEPGHPKEESLFARIEDLIQRDEARGILVFAEPRHVAKYLALKIQARFGSRGIRSAFVTGEGDAIAERYGPYLQSLRSGPRNAPRRTLGSWEEIREEFQRPQGSEGPRINIIVATSKLAVGTNLSAAEEAHIYTMHADAQKLIQMVGRVGRPDGDNFFDRVGRCFYHVTRNTPEWFLFKSAIRKYQWIRDTLSSSADWGGEPS